MGPIATGHPILKWPLEPQKSPKGTTPAHTEGSSPRRGPTHRRQAITPGHGTHAAPSCLWPLISPVTATRDLATGATPMGKRLWSVCSPLPHHVPQCRDSPSSHWGSNAPQRDALRAAAAPVPQARVRVDLLATAPTGDAITRALPALRPGAKRRYTRAVTDSTRRQNAGRKDRKSDGNPVQSQSFPGI